MGAVRWTYNAAVKHIKDGFPFTEKSLRDHCVRNDAALLTDKPYIKAVPWDVRDEAIRDVRKAIKNMLSKRESPKDMQFRKWNDQQHSFVLRKRFYYTGEDLDPNFRINGQPRTKPIKKPRKRSMRGYSIITTVLKTCKEKLPLTIIGDTRIIMRRSGDFYIVIHHDDPAPTVLSSQRIVSLDPGVRTFQSTYDPSGRFTEWGRNDMEGIVRMKLSYRKLQSKCDKCKNRRRKGRIRVALQRKNDKIKHRIEDIHRRLIMWLLKNHDVILLPNFGSKKMRMRNGLAPAVRSSLQTWSHFTFKLRLMSKANMFPDKKVFIVNESYTSVTCTSCGFRNKKNKNKHFRCRGCHFECDRDFNGARNILIKFLTEQEQMLQW